MSDSVVRHNLDRLPDESTIRSFRKEAKESDASVELTYPAPTSERKRIVISPRGTVVLLNDVSEETFNRSRSAEEIATALRE